MLPHWALLCLMIGLSFVLASCGKDDKKKTPSPNSPEAIEEPAETREPDGSPTPVTPLPLVGDPLAEPAQLSGWEQTRWLNHMAQDLLGRDLTAAERDQYAAMDRAEATLAMLEQEEFWDTTLSFNLYFLGFGRDSVRLSDGTISTAILNFPAALASAKAVAKGGDYFQLLQWQQPYFVPPMQPAAMPYDPENPEPNPDLTQTEILDHLFGIIARRIQEVLVDEEAGEFDRDLFCERVGFSNGGIATTLFYLGLPSEIVTDLRQSDSWLGDIDLYCFLPNQPKPEVVDRFTGMRQRLPELRQFIDDHSADTYALTSVSSVAEILPEKLGLPTKQAFTTIGFYQNLQNSSTNFNRRRGSYVLKRFFCDDLTPISIEIPDSHGGDQHASDPGCQSCHYKLDPMAGFFKEIGLFGKDFTEADEIQFDDFATMDKAEYQSGWRADSTDREWNIGYIRSATDPTQNSYGESLGDLFAVIQQSREPKRCLVKRLVEYFIGEDQVMDQGFVEHVTTKLEEESAAMSSAQGFKRAVARVVLSQTYSTADRNNKVCYDTAPGEQPPAGSPPCEVAFVLEQNCVSCHSKTGAMGGLDLSSWQVDPTGRPNFRHLDGEGNILGAKTTFERIQDRLTTTAESRRMHLDQHISSADLETLYLWVEDSLNTLSQGGQ